MKKYLLISLVSLFSMTAYSQEHSGKLYDDMCDHLQAVFCDYVRKDSEVRFISNNQGQYLGTLIDNALYGWGYYLSSNGSKSFGQYRKGELLFGLIISEDVAKVGSKENYVVYDLYTGNIMRLHTFEGDVPLSYPYIPAKDGKNSPYSFKKEIYANGDYFYGEFYNGKRHGYGVYCWTNDDMWYGHYKEGYRSGYGMLVKSGRMVYYGKWIGDSKVE